MFVNDPLSDMIARIKNAAQRQRSKVLTPASKLRAHVLDVLKDEGYIRGYSVIETPGEFPQFEIELKYFDGQPVIVDIARIKNAAQRQRSTVKTPASKLRAHVLDVLKDEGYIRGYEVVETPGEFPQFEIELKYFEGQPVIAEISRVSKPGRRVYSSIKDLKPVKNGLGISILSTPKGVMSDTAARDANVGGEVLCRVY